ncbi:MAG: anaerobic ribonucleoside-triphosphate reductase activating protein [Deltaproteobacteria bacterium]|nr:MAG: anaerobic ribonucleoside-triphosphate reductase activating protein [Deltaproteobacteria bacterium]
MAIKGFQGTSLLDFPGRIASLVFFHGCNLSCPFCHNPALLGDPRSLPDFPVELLFEELEQRCGFIDGIVLTGGEPTLAPELDEVVEAARELGLLVKLDTNGLAPRVLERLLGRGRLDYVALDLKTVPERYGELHRRPVDPDALKRSLELLKAADIDWELRTTCVPGFVEQEDLLRMAELARGARRWVLQQYSGQVTFDPAMAQCEPHPVQVLKGWRDLVADCADEVLLRGV